MNEQTLFTEASERVDPRDRRAFLDQACQGDSALRARIERLLAQHEHAVSFLEAHAPVSPPTHHGPLPETAGVLVGPYKLLEEIGEGGMGTVWMAQQTEPVKRVVALKLIKAGMDSKQVVARFEAERQALALMDHPHIARVLDGGTNSSGRPYFVMDLVKGVPITKYCDEHRLTLRHRLELFIPVCQAIQHAHQKGIIHRDLKPSNVLVALYDCRPVPKVIDFGVAKATGQPLTEQTLVTSFGNIVGTLEYMSPEQAEFNQLDIDTRSDIYSLGVLLYELLTGTTPLEPKRVKKSGLLEALRIIREEEVPTLSHRLSTTVDLPAIAANRGTDPAKLTKLVRGELDWIVTKALEKDRARRYETAIGLAMDLHRYLADEAVLACPPSAGYRLRKFARRNRTAVTVASLALVFLMFLGSGVGWTLRDRAARQSRVGAQVYVILNEVDRLERAQQWPEALLAARRAEAAVAGGESDLATRRRVQQRIKDLKFIERLEQLRFAAQDDVVLEREYSAAFREYGVDLDQLDIMTSIERLTIRPALTIPLAAALDEWNSVRRSTIIQRVGESSGWVQRRHKLSPRRALTDDDLSGWSRLVDVVTGLDPDPVRNQVRSVWRRPAAEGRDELRRVAASIDVSSQHPTTLYLLARSLERNKDWDDAARLLQKAQYVHPADFQITFNLGMVFTFKKNYEEAIRYFSAAVSLRPNHGGARTNLGNVLKKFGRIDEAIAEYRKGVELQPSSSGAMQVLADLLYDQGQLDEVVAIYRKYIQAYPTAPHPYYRLGCVLREQGKLKEANAAFNKAIEFAHVQVAAAPDYSSSHVSLADLFRDLGRRNEAIDAYRRAIQLDPTNGTTYNNLATVLFHENRLIEAVEVYNQALKVNPQSAIAYGNLGNALNGLNRLDEAIDACRAAIAIDPEYAYPYATLGTALAIQRQWGEAEDAYRNAIELDPTNALACLNLGAVLANLGESDEAILALRQALEIDPSLIKAYCDLGSILSSQGKLEEAIDVYQQAIRIDSKSNLAARTYFNLAKALEEQGKPDEAIACFEQAVALDPQSVVAHNALSWLLTNCHEEKLRNPQRGLEVAHRAVALSPQSDFAWQMLGWAHYRTGDWNASIEALQKSCDLQQQPTGGDAYQWFFLAMAHGQLGNYQQAFDWYEKSVQWMENIGAKSDALKLRAEAEGLFDTWAAQPVNETTIDPHFLRRRAQFRAGRGDWEGAGRISRSRGPEPRRFVTAEYHRKFLSPP